MNGSITNELATVLHRTRELLARPDSDFVGSHWGSQELALDEFDSLIGQMQVGDYSKREALELLFAPTGSIQEVSMSSGWGEEFLVLAERFDLLMRTNTRDKTICERAGVVPATPPPNSKVGIAIGSLGKSPINGSRHREVGDTNGWYIWCGELSTADDFFAPLHVEHLKEYLPAVLGYLDLPPGYRFLIDGNGYGDVWFDQALLAE